MPRYIELAPQLVRLYRLNLDCGDVIKEFLLTAQTADVRKNVKAHWIKEEYFGGIFKCSNCRKYVDFRGLKGTQDPANFCPHCGAIMDEGRKR